MKKNDLLKLLYEGIVQVAFIKADGSERKMLCTLNDEHFPDVEINKMKDAKERKHSVEALRVWDVEKEAWRSFRYDSVFAVNEFRVDEILIED